VLQSINFKIDPGTKVGIIGRTGGGKSSIFAALLRLTDPNTTEGAITLDGKELGGVSLQRVRRGITMVNQHPVLFNGTLRFNLDPCGIYEDVDMNFWIKQVKLVSFRLHFVVEDA
jgi:ABC-type multidrug transport system fused ATPase/permease subunit